tara:strand:- start:382 stop:2298 length:1917 start_codon:yes stop_codon:yes gene_type:complete
MTNKNEILSRLDIESYYNSKLSKLKWNGSGNGMAICPFHNDTKPSLSIQKKTGSFNCFGCEKKGSIFDFRMEIENKDYKTVLNDFAEELGINTNEKGCINKTYDYRDEDGQLLSQVIRYKPKRFSQRQPDGNGGWINNIKDVTAVPYNLQNVIKAEEVFIPEGENDCDRLNVLGLTATTNPMGAGKWKPDYSSYLKDKNVVILPDNDDIGKSHAQAVAKSLFGIANSIIVLELPNLPEGGDVSDFLDSFEDIEDAKESLAIKVDECAEWKPEESNNNDAWQFVNTQDWFKSEPPKREDLFHNVITKGIVGMIAALGGTGKTYFLICIILSAIMGKKIFNSFNPKKSMTVLALLGEDPPDEIWRRFRAITERVEIEIDFDALKQNLKLICGTSEPLMKIDNGNPTTTDRYEWLKTKIKEFSPDLILIDPKSQWYGLEENNNDHNTQWVNSLKDLSNINGSTVLFSHHVTKSSGGELSQLSARGGGALADACRWVANLRKIPQKDAGDYELDDAQLYVEFRITKNSYAPLLPESIFFKFEQGGGLVQVDLEANKQRRIAESLREVLLETKNELSINEICSRSAGKEIRQKLKDDCGSKTSAKNIKSAIEYGLSNKVLINDTIYIGEKCKPKAIIQPVRFN